VTALDDDEALEHRLDVIADELRTLRELVIELLGLSPDGATAPRR
jgi:hypothetical protein